MFTDLDLNRKRLKESQWVILLMPAAFFWRRLFMSLSLVFVDTFFWGQIAIQLYTSTAMLILVGEIKPYKSKFTTGMEMFNECITLIILYMVMCFTQFVGDPSTRGLCGWGFIGVTSLFVAVHLTILICGSCCAVRLWCRRRDHEAKKEAYRSMAA